MNLHESTKVLSFQESDSKESQCFFENSLYKTKDGEYFIFMEAGENVTRDGKAYGKVSIKIEKVKAEQLLRVIDGAKSMICTCLREENDMLCDDEKKAKEMRQTKAKDLKVPLCGPFFRR